MALSNVCHGCLSVDRKLTLIEEHAKLYHQMLLKKSTDKTRMILMCWECHKTLHNIHLFRMKITQAQKLLNEKLPKAYKSLSNLTHLKKIDDYQIIIYEEEKINTVDIEIEVKNEKQENEIYPEINNHDTNLKLPEIKEEYKDEDDNFDNGVDCFDGGEEPKVELVSVAMPEIQVKAKQGRKKRRALKQKYKTIIMADIQDKRSFYDTEKIDQKSAEKWMERKKKRTSKKKFQCSLCFCGFGQQKFYEQHLAKRHDKRHKYECDLCSFRLPLYSKLRRHVVTHFVQFKCKLCAQIFPARDMLYVHLAHGPHTKQMECRVCGARFDCNKARQFFAHYRTMHGSKICDYCGQRCTTKSRLAHHIKCRHTPILCKICGSEFKSLHSLKKHNDRKHVVDASERNYCVECDVQFANSHLYQDHVKRSSKHSVKPSGRSDTADLSERNYCVEFDVQFANSHLYQEHVTRSVKHSVKPRVPCPECDRTYSKRCYMMNHYNMEHLKDSKHICTICDKRFLTGHRLRCHRMFTHEKIPKPKNNICNYCGRGFNTKRILENHIRTHTGERPFACAHCSAAFAQDTALKTHVRSAHK